MSTVSAFIKIKSKIKLLLGCHIGFYYRILGCTDLNWFDTLKSNRDSNKVYVIRHKF